jgi:hypothetical protein
MEHRLLLGGGEQWLPFARNQIKRLRAGGLSYATKDFVMPDGAQVKVKIAGRESFITLSGGDIKVLSGLIKNGTRDEVPSEEIAVNTTPTYILNSYKPTQNAWEAVLGKNPDTPTDQFKGSRFLARDTDNQYEDLCPSMFSGLMAKAVQIIMGRGQKVRYGHRFSLCHGIVLSEDDKPWLVQLSTDGIYAMRLPQDRGNSKSKATAITESVELFGGVPRGGVAFPKDAVLTDAVKAGTVLELASADEVNAFYSKTPFSSALGWAFSDNGREAHNTVYYTPTGSDELKSCLYKLTISIGELNKDRKDDDPLAEGSATLSLVEEGRLILRASKTYPNPSGGTIAVGVENCPFYFYEPDSGTVVPVPRTAVDGASVINNVTAPLLACYVNGVLDVVRMTVIGSQGVSTDDSNYDAPFTSEINHVSVVYSDSISPDARGTTWLRRVSTFRDKFYTGTNAGGEPLDFFIREYDAVSKLTQKCLSVGTTSDGVRDGYEMYEGKHWFDDIVGSSDTVFAPPGLFYPGPYPTRPSVTTTVRTDVPARLYIVTPTEVATETIDDPEEPDAKTFWEITGPSYLSSRATVFGAAPLYTYQKTPWLDLDVTLVGDLFGTEITPSGDKFNFVGYT